MMVSWFRLACSAILIVWLAACSSPAKIEVPKVVVPEVDLPAAEPKAEETSPEQLSEPVSEVPKAPEVILPSALDAQLQKASELISQDNMPQAQELLLQIDQKWPDYPQASLNLAALAIKQQQTQPAIEWLEKAQSKTQLDHRTLNSIAIAYRKLGQFAKAEQFYLASIEKAPGYPLAHLNLGILYELYFFKLNLALQQYQRYQALLDEPDQQVSGWIKDLQARGVQLETAEVAQ